MRVSGPPLLTTDPNGIPMRIDRSRYLALIAMLFAVAMTFIDQTIVAIAAPTIQSELALSRTGTQWAVNAYLLALAAVFPLGGRLADVQGSRRMVTIGIVGFAASSALCGATPTGAPALAWLVAFRAAQGAFGALMIPAALAIVLAAFPVHERGRAMALFFGISGGMTAIGPVVGGYLTQWTWRSIFWVNVPIAVIALVLTTRATIASSPPRRDRIDIPGAVLVAAGMALSVLGFQQAQTWGWRSPATWSCILGGTALLTTFALTELRTASPLLQLRIFQGRAFFIDNIVLFAASIAFVPAFFFASVYAQVSLHYQAEHAGLYLLLIFAGYAPGAQLGGRLLDKHGARRPMVLGSALSCAGFALWASKVTELSLAKQWPFIVMAGAGLGLLVTAASTDAVNRAINATYGEVIGITQTTRNYGSSLGFAILGTALTTTFAHRLTSTLEHAGISPSAAAATAQRAATSSTISSGLSHAPPGVAHQIQASIGGDFATATRAVLIGMAIALGAAFIAATRCPRRAPKPSSSDELSGVPRKGPAPQPQRKGL